MSDPQEKAGFTVAMVGNPNVGKSTLFNALTGMKQHIGNWPGVTVEKKVGRCTHLEREIDVVDLPGMYSTVPYSIDERVARDFLVDGGPDAVVHVVDATNLERNLYLTIQLVEMGLRPVIALTMMDLAADQGIAVDPELLSKEIGLKVVPINATRKEGLDRLMSAVLKNDGGVGVVPAYPVGLVDDLEAIRRAMAEAGDEAASDWRAMNIISGDLAVIDRLTDDAAESVRKVLADTDADRNEMAVADQRYALVGRVASKASKRPPRRRSRSDRIDSVITHKYLGIPIFLTIMWAVFELTFVLAEPFMELIDMVFATAAESAMENLGGTLGSLIGDGIITGVGSVLIFLPSIMMLFLLLGILEESGYLARAAFVMDRVMHAIGLQGKSMIPMLMGFGCNVPAIMATRTIEDDKDRMISILINPFMSCSARLPVYILLAGIFFSDIAGTVVFALYVTGILVGIGSAKLFRATLFPGEPAPFIMELPCYKMPGAKASLQRMLDKGWIFVRKAGTIILLAVVILWTLSYYPSGVEYASQDSYIGMIGMFFEPLVAPLGFDWKIAVALIFGFIAKEVVIGALGTLYGVGDDGEGLQQQLLDDPSWGPVTALGVMAFVLLYTPCVAAIGVIRRETGSNRLTLLSVTYGLLVAWLAAFLIWNLGSMLIG